MTNFVRLRIADTFPPEFVKQVREYVKGINFPLSTEDLVFVFPAHRGVSYDFRVMDDSDPVLIVTNQIAFLWSGIPKTDPNAEDRIVVGCVTTGSRHTVVVDYYREHMDGPKAIPIFKTMPLWRLFTTKVGGKLEAESRFYDHLPLEELFHPSVTPFFGQFHEACDLAQVGYEITYQEASREWYMRTISAAPAEEVIGKDAGIAIFALTSVSYLFLNHGETWQNFNYPTYLEESE